MSKILVPNNTNPVFEIVGRVKKINEGRKSLIIEDISLYNEGVRKDNDDFQFENNKWEILVSANPYKQNSDSWKKIKEGATYKFVGTLNVKLRDSFPKAGLSLGLWFVDVIEYTEN